MYIEDALHLAMLFCRTPMALVTVHEGEKRQIYPRGFSKEPENFPVGLIPVTEMVMVSDSWRDHLGTRVKSIDPEIRAFAAAPLFGKGERLLGALCVMDNVPRRLTTEQMEALSLLARLTRCCLDLEQKQEDCNQIQHALRESERRYRNLTETILDGFFQSSLDGKMIGANSAFRKMLGFDTIDELLAVRIDAIFSDSVTPNRLTRPLDAEGELRQMETVIIRRNGSRIEGTIHGQVIRDHHGVPIYFEAVVNTAS